MNKAAGVFLIFVVVGTAWATQKPVFAASQDECAIWLCLPGGFGQGCSAAEAAMYKRIKKKKSPLPNFGECSSGESGNYRMGDEPFVSCKEGYTLEIKGNNTAQCLGGYTYQYCGRDVSPAIDLQVDGDRCYYTATPRPKPHFIEMWVSGEYLGKFFYQ